MQGRQAITRVAGVLAAAALLALAGPAAAQDAEAGKVKSRPCVTCHGANGIGTMPHFPNLAGQKSQYLAQQLYAYRDGRRQNEMMRIIAEPLSDEDIEDLAAYYESLPPGGGSD